MLRGQLVELRWVNVNIEDQIAHLPMTKNGMARAAPQFKKAVATWLHFHSPSTEGSTRSLHAAVRKACKRAGIKDLHWHDLRHTTITRLAQKLPNVIELAAVSGHRSLAMLKSGTTIRQLPSWRES